MIELRTTNARGVLCGESQPMCVWPDSLVAEARAPRAQGLTIHEITAHLSGPHHTTVWRWVAGTARKPAVRVTVKRVKNPESFEANHQFEGATAAPTRSGKTPGFADAVKFTDIE